MHICVPKLKIVEARNVKFAGWNRNQGQPCALFFKIHANFGRNYWNLKLLYAFLWSVGLHSTSIRSWKKKKIFCGTSAQTVRFGKMFDTFNLIFHYLLLAGLQNWLFWWAEWCVCMFEHRWYASSFVFSFDVSNQCMQFCRELLVENATLVDRCRFPRRPI